MEDENLAQIEAIGRVVLAESVLDDYGLLYGDQFKVVKEKDGIKLIPLTPRTPEQLKEEFRQRRLKREAYNANRKKLSPMAMKQWKQLEAPLPPEILNECYSMRGLEDFAVKP
jgi:hypothetical protein